MPTTPAARPSSPSTKFTALTVATTMKAVSSAPWAGSRENWLSSLAVKRLELHAGQTRKPAASTCPPSLVSASSSKRSSRMPDRADQRAGDQHEPASRKTNGPLASERKGSSRATR